MESKSCFFIGSHDCPDCTYPRILDRIEKVISEDNITNFYVGNHGKFDHMSAKAVVEMKQKYPEIKLFLLLPYPRKRIVLENGFDDCFVPPDIPRGKFSIIRANRYMTDHVDCIITGVFRVIGNSSKVLKHAYKRYKKGGLRIEDTLAPMRIWNNEPFPPFGKIS